MATGVVSWSTTASSNATADAAINWAEGQAPSSVNDSARALMASVAKYRDDHNGSITTTGTSTAYAVTSNQGLSLSEGALVAFVPHATNGATVTINVDSLGAKPLRVAPGVELTAGTILLGTPYTATYYTSNSGEWILHGFYSQASNPYGVPIGGALPYLGSTAPNSNFALPYGQAISRTTYASLFAVCSTAFGTGNGSTTFNLPDIRGRSIFGLDNMGGTAASRVTTAGSSIDGTTVGTAGGEQSHTLNINEMPSHSHSGSTGSGGSHNHNIASDASLSAFDNTAGTGPQIGSGNLSRNLSLNTTSTAAAHTHTISAAGGDGAHNNMPPSIILPFIVRIL